MFHTGKKTNQDRNKNQAKFLDPKRDIHGRLKALRVLFDILSELELKLFFFDYSTEIFFVFYEEFTNLELSAKSKGTRIKEELEELLIILEKLLLYLPEKVHDRWQFNAIGLVLRKLLHCGNLLLIREVGIRLFLTWLQILQENVDELNLALFGSIIPGFPSCINKVNIPATHRSKDVLEYLISCVGGKSVNSGLFTSKLENESEWCVADGCYAICLPQAGEKLPVAEELTKKFLDKVLDYMSKKLLEIQWKEKHMREMAFYHMFCHFHRFYLPNVYPKWNPKDYLYSEMKEIISVPLNERHDDETSSQQSLVILSCQRAVICWLIAFTNRLKRKTQTHTNPSTPVNSVTKVSAQETSTGGETSCAVEDKPLHSQSSTSSDLSVLPQSRQFEYLCETADIVRSVLYSTQKNIIVLHEILRQSFLMPLTTGDTMNHVLLVYKEWFFRIQDRPLFMLEPKKHSFSVVSNDAENSPLLRTPSYKEAVESCEQVFFANLPVQSVRAGYQPNLRLFIAVTAQIFFEKQNKDTLAKHADICKRIMKMYRSIVLETRPDALTWRQLLTVLLKIADHILTARPPVPRYSTLGGHLAGYLLQTLFVTWIRASLQVHLSNELWNDLLRVCSTFSSWEELVKEWASTMETLTRVMARIVYGIDLQDPPLNKLTAKDKVKLKRNVPEQTSENPMRQEHVASESAVERVLSRFEEPAVTIPRSFSEPGITSESLVHLKKDVSAMSSESALTQTKREPNTFDVNKAEDYHASNDQINILTKQMLQKRTLAELADNKYMTESYDSDTNSVFTHSFNINTNMTLLEALTFDANKRTSQPIDTLALPKVNIEQYSDTDSDGPTNGLGTYETLNDTNTSSESSSMLRGALSVTSINSCFSESSENLLAEFNEDEEETDNKNSDKEHEYETEGGEAEAEVTLTTPVHDGVSDDIIEAESKPENSSDQDLISFGIDSANALESRRTALDAQSVDSHMFTNFEDESFSELKSTEISSEQDIVEGSDEDETSNDNVSSPHVRFTENSTVDLENAAEKLSQSISKRSTDRKLVSVIEGGVIEGWTPISAVVLWRRILGILGNVNEIHDQEVHACVYQQLIQIWKNLEMIKQNQGVSTDNKSTPPPPLLTPPLFFCSTWCFQGMSLLLSPSHKKGRVLAYKLMCMMTIRNHGLKPSVEHMVHFYRLLHHGLTGTDQDVINAIISECHSFFTLEFDGAMCLVLDFIYGATTVVNTQYMNYPRKAAMSLLGSMLCLPGVYPAMSIYSPGKPIEPYNCVRGKDLRDKILVPILKAVKNDPSSRARCVALSCLGVFIVEALIQLDGHARIYECLALLISSLEFHSLVVSTVALDILWTLTFYHDRLQQFDKDLPLKIVESLCIVALQLQTARKTSTSDVPKAEDCGYLSKLLLCLLDWCMVLPQEMLLESRIDRDDSFTFFGLVMKVFQRCSEDKQEVLNLDRRRSLNICHLFINDARPMRLARVHNDLNMDEEQVSEDETDFLRDMNHGETNVLRLTAEYAISQILNYYQHFPFDTGAVRMTSLVLENEDSVNSTDDLSAVLDSNNVQFLLIDDKLVLSIVELPQQVDFTCSTNYESSKTISRLLMRDYCGKYCWEVGDLFANKNDETLTLQASTYQPRSSSISRRHSRNLSVTNARLITSCSSSLPTWNAVDPNTDRVDQLLRYIGESSPECLLFADQKLNVPAPVPEPIDLIVQSSVVTSVLKQHNEEENYVHEISHDPRITASEIYPPEYCDPTSPFHVSKMLLHQLGFLSWNKRTSIELLEKNERLIRDIKNLDNRPCRETQKIAVFYVASGQEDKQSILSNSKASVKFEEFLAGMAWEVDLATHTGFMGGLQRNLSTGKSAPYFATHSTEVIFHVSTRMPGSEEEQLKTKLRHLGNDEVHIIWSEHNRDFRRGIINTEFGDVLIIIYPMENNLYRVKIDRLPKIPPFGPLFDGAIVDGVLLPVLIRSTAISAGRAKRSTLSYYKQHFEERARCINEISRSRVRHTSFEDFAASLFAPGRPQTSHESNEPDTVDGLHRTLSAPSRSNTISDTSSVLKLLDMPDTSFRLRAASSVLKSESRVVRALSSTSLNTATGEDSTNIFSDSDQKDLRDGRRRSITKRIKKKVSSVDIPFGITDKATE